jgi:hypothetical protein
LGRNSSQNSEIWGCGGQKCRYEETPFGAFLQTAVKKIYRDSGQTKKIPCAKEQIKDIGHGRFFQAPKMGKFFIEAAWAHILPGRTKNVPKTGPKCTRGTSL